MEIALRRRPLVYTSVRSGHVATLPEVRSLELRSNSLLACTSVARARRHMCARTRLFGGDRTPSRHHPASPKLLSSSLPLAPWSSLGHHTCVDRWADPLPCLASSSSTGTIIGSWEKDAETLESMSMLQTPRTAKKSPLALALGGTPTRPFRRRGLCSAARLLEPLQAAASAHCSLLALPWRAHSAGQVSQCGPQTRLR